jgi:hypothetical protein
MTAAKFQLIACRCRSPNRRAVQTAHG